MRRNHIEGGFDCGVSTSGSNANHVYIYNNLFVRNNSGYIEDQTAGTGITDVRLVGNVFYDQGNDWSWNLRNRLVAVYGHPPNWGDCLRYGDCFHSYGSQSGLTTSCLFTRNICCKDRRTHIKASPHDAGFTFDYNHFDYSANGWWKWGEEISYTFSGWQAAGRDTHSTIEDPLGGVCPTVAEVVALLGDASLTSPIVDLSDDHDGDLVGFAGTAASGYAGADVRLDSRAQANGGSRGSPR